MKIAFFGTPSFSVPVLESLYNSKHQIVVVITQPDRPVGRKQILTKSAIKECAQKYNLPVLQPKKVSDFNFLSAYKKYNIDLNLIVSFGQILPDELIYYPKFNSVNIHASLLPKYRGASPINWAIINGDEKTGITYQFIEKRLDAGDIIYTEEIKIENTDTSITLYNKLSQLSAKTVVEVLDMIENNQHIRTKQNNNEASYVKILKKEDGKIDFNNKAENIFNKIRGLLPWPCAFCFLDDKMLKIYSAQIINKSTNNNFQPGEIIEIIKNSGIVVACKDSFLLIKEVQIEGGKRMDAYNFSLGQKNLVSKILK